MKLPVYRMIVPEEGSWGVDFVALVDDPAIQMNWQAFAGKERFKADKDRQIISGPLMVANMPIYRRDERGEYYVVFDAPTIERIIHKFFKNGSTSNVNQMHDPTAKLDGVYMFESFQVTETLSPQGWDLPVGSWYGSYKVDNKDVWEQFIKTGEFKGFSVEGFFDEERIVDEEQEIIEMLIEALK